MNLVVELLGWDIYIHTGEPLSNDFPHYLHTLTGTWYVLP
jgi:hypothetical protein